MTKLSYAPSTGKAVAVLYLARGADADHVASFRRFIRSYRTVPAGAEHKLFVIFKGFTDDRHLRSCQDLFADLDYVALHTADDSFDIGAYAEAIRQVPFDKICCLNTNSVVVAEGWLGKLAVNLDQPDVGIVGATGSFESLRLMDARFPHFPNPHIRSNAFMMAREVMLPIFSAFQIHEKKDAFLAESGEASISQQIFAKGLAGKIVGRDGRGYGTQWWPISQTFRQGTQGNLLVSDNVTRIYERLPWSAKAEISYRTWGGYLQREYAAGSMPSAVAPQPQAR